MSRQTSVQYRRKAELTESEYLLSRDSAIDGARKKWLPAAHPDAKPLRDRKRELARKRK